MATFETSFYQQAKPFEIESPVKQYATLAQLRMLQDQSAMSGLQRQDAERKLKREGELASIYRDAGGDSNKLSQLLGQRGFFPEMQALQKDARAAGKETAEREKTNMETILKKMEISRNALAQVNSDADMPGYRSIVEQIWGADVASRTPERFDPQWKNNVLLTAEQHFQAAQNALNRQTTERGQTLTADSSALGRDVQRRGQDITAETAAADRALRERSVQNLPVEGAGIIQLPTHRPASGGPAMGSQVMGPSGQPLSRPGKDIPANINTAITENNTAVQKVEEAIAAVRERPNAFGLKNIAPDELMQRLDPDGIKARALVADLGSLKIHDRSGAAVTAAEFPRLKPFIPNAKDTPEAVLKKLDNFKREYESIMRDMAETYSSRQGYKESPILQNTRTRNVRIGGQSLVAERAPDGQYYVQRDGKYFKVEF